MKNTISLISTFIVAFACVVLASCKSDDSLMKLDNWVAEDVSGEATITVKGDQFDIVAPDGLTLWYNKKLTGNYQISYDAMMPMSGSSYERLSDLNCFWSANDPLFPDNIFERSAWRNGVFKNYNSMNLFYVGYGGNHNTTTRFRRYYGEYFEKEDDKIKPLLFEYVDADKLLKANKWYHIEILVSATTTRFMVDGELLFSHHLTPNEGDGYFGLRLLTNHTLFANFKVEQIN